jgi:hypothetical protein
MSCYKTTNNKYFNCPPRMADGRHFTDYRPHCDLNNLVASNNQLVSSYDYRQYLIQNSEKLMDINRSYSSGMNSCGPCKTPYDQGTMLPEQSDVQCSANTCANSMRVLSGLGQGRKYDSGDSNTQCGTNWQFPKNVPSSNCAQDADVFDYYNGSQIRQATDAKQMRYAMPSGGLPLSGGDPAAF